MFFLMISLIIINADLPSTIFLSHLFRFLSFIGLMLFESPNMSFFVAIIQAVSLMVFVITWNILFTLSLKVAFILGPIKGPYTG